MPWSVSLVGSSSARSSLPPSPPSLLSLTTRTVKASPPVTRGALAVSRAAMRKEVSSPATQPPGATPGPKAKQRAASVTLKKV